jgi:hypothetical protein
LVRATVIKLSEPSIDGNTRDVARAIRSWMVKRKLAGS